MTDRPPTAADGWADQEPLALTVGCTFGLNSVQPASAIMQVAPRLENGPLTLTSFEVRASSPVAPAAA